VVLNLRKICMPALFASEPSSRRVGSRDIGPVERASWRPGELPPAYPFEAGQVRAAMDRISYPFHYPAKRQRNVSNGLNSS
jgi:hypothetical protein